MNPRIPLMATAVATLLFIASPGIAQPMHDAGLNYAHMGQMMDGRETGMDLTGITVEKRQSIRQIQADYRDRLFRLQQDIYGRCAALYSSMLQSPPDPVAAKAVSREISALRVEELDLLIEMHTRIARETGVRLPMGMRSDGMMAN